MSPDPSRLHDVLLDWYASSAAPYPRFLDHRRTTDLLDPRRLADFLASAQVTVDEADGEIRGVVVVERPSAHHALLSLIAVPESPDQERLARDLLARVVRELRSSAREQPVISAVVPADNVAAGRLLLDAGFVGIRAVGEDEPLRVQYQYKERYEITDRDGRHLIPTSSGKEIRTSLAAVNHAVTGLFPLSDGYVFEVSVLEGGDPATLRSAEAAAGIAFSGSVLSAMTFLLGLAFTSDKFPDDVRLLLIGAAFSTTLSLIIYASATGELARLRAQSFERIMKWGNVLSEYGGVLPFLISLPLTYAQSSEHPEASIALAAVLGVAVAGYELSSFSIASRFERSYAEMTLRVLTALSPLIGVLLIVLDWVSWPWTLTLMATLGARTFLYVARREAEDGVAGRQWLVRQRGAPAAERDPRTAARTPRRG